MPGNHIEEKYLPSPFWGWLILVLFSASLLGFGMWLMMSIPDVPRQWNFGAYPDTPAESVYSTGQLPLNVILKRAVPMLPEANTEKRIRSQGPAAGTQRQPPGGPSRWLPRGETRAQSGSETPQGSGKK